MKTIDSFPLTATADSDSLSKIINILNPAVDAGSIRNVDLKDAKFLLNRLTEKMFFCGGLFYHTDLWFTTASYAKGRIKAAEKLARKTGVDLSSFIAAATEIQALSESFDGLAVVKREMRSEEERAEDYVPPIPNTVAAKVCSDVLHTLTDGLTKEYEEILFNGFVADVQYTMDHPRQRSEKRQATYAELFLMPLVGEKWDSFNGCYTALKPNFRAILRNRAKHDSEFAQAMFIYKNVSKLAVIVETKGNLVSTNILAGNVTGHGFSGEIVFHFADNSSFVVRNKVVVKYSTNNKPFRQFPTTFHYATLPNGGRMPGQPSEQEMHEIFSKGVV